MRYIIFIFLVTFSFSTLADINLLTSKEYDLKNIQNDLDRIKRDLTILQKEVFQKQHNQWNHLGSWKMLHCQDG